MFENFDMNENTQMLEGGNQNSAQNFPSLANNQNQNNNPIFNINPFNNMNNNMLNNIPINNNLGNNNMMEANMINNNNMMNNNLMMPMQIGMPIPIPPFNIFNNNYMMDMNSTMKSFEQLFGNLIGPNNLFISTKSLNLNIIHYDEALTKTADNNLCCSYFKMELGGTFYGVNNFNLFKYICRRVSKSSKNFILLSSGSCSQKVFDYCLNKNINNIPIYYIYCYNREKYIPLMNKYPKLKGIFTLFDELKAAISSNNNMFNIPIKSSNLIFLSDYNNTYIKLHFEIVRKYSLYKLLKSNNYNQSKFLDLIRKKSPYYMNIAKELLYNDDDAMINFFKNNTTETEDNLRKVFNHNHNINSYISNYTVESFYYQYLNKFLREGDFNSFRLLSNHISKFIYHLYEYRKTLLQPGFLTLYRHMYISEEEFNLYQNSIGKVICYPSFTSTSALEDTYYSMNSDPNKKILVKLIIQQNNSHSIINIRNLSQHPNEEEYLCLPFSFFKIINVECKNENGIHKDIIYLTALNSEKPLEEMFLEFMENETDNLDPDGLQMLKLINNDTTLILNPWLKSEMYLKADYDLFL